MITDTLLSLLIAFLNTILHYFTTQADVPAFTALRDAILAANSYYSALSPVFPIGTVILIVAFRLTFEGIYFVYKLIRWAYRKVPGIT